MAFALGLCLPEASVLSTATEPRDPHSIIQVGLLVSQKNYVLSLWFEMYPKEKSKPKPKLAQILRKYEYLGNNMLNCKWLLTKCPILRHCTWWTWSRKYILLKGTLLIFVTLEKTEYVVSMTPNSSNSFFFTSTDSHYFTNKSRLKFCSFTSTWVLLKYYI